MSVEIFKPQSFLCVDGFGRSNAGDGLAFGVDSATVFVAEFEAIAAAFHFNAPEDVLALAVFVEPGVEECVNVVVGGGGEGFICLQQYPLFALFSPFCDGALEQAGVVVYGALGFCLGDGFDVSPVGVCCGGLAGLSFRGGWLLVIVGGAGKQVNDAYPECNAHCGGSQYVCFVFHFLPRSKSSLDPFFTRLGRSVQSLTGGAHGG